MRLLLLAALPALLAIVGVAATTVRAEGGAGDSTVLVELRIWQNVGDTQDIWVSARPVGGDWDELGTFPFPFAEDGTGRRWPPTDHYRAGQLAVAGVELTIAQRQHVEPSRIYVSPCSYPPSCGLILVQLDDGHSPGGRFRYGHITLAAPVAGEVSPAPETLQADLEHLQALREVLTGTRAPALNWHPDLAVTHWTGVTVAGTPARVTGLDLAESDLGGSLSGLLGDLTGLRELRLESNNLDGSIPSKLHELKSLTHLYLGGNEIQGCVQPLLRNIANNDLDSLDLPDCPPPLDAWEAPGLLGDAGVLDAGTYRLEGLVFDVPLGLRLESAGLSINGSVAVGLRAVSGEPRIWITFDAGSSRWTHDEWFDRIDESMWWASDALLALWTEAWETKTAQDTGDLSDSTPSAGGR